MTDRAPNVVLTGFMGTGKTTVGRLLARRLGHRFVDTDAVIEQRHGPIPAIFAEQGEAAFRAMEASLAAELVTDDGLVVSTGGGMLVDPTVADRFLAWGRVFCLTAAPEAILARVGADRSRIDRPLLAVDDPAARIRELLAERAEAYARFDAVATDGLGPAAVADAVIARLDERR